MFYFLQELRYIDPTIFIGIDVGEDKNLLIKWGLTEEAASELRDDVCDDIIWSNQILYH